jgi:hypothetical protein
MTTPPNINPDKLLRYAYRSFGFLGRRESEVADAYGYRAFKAKGPVIEE